MKSAEKIKELLEFYTNIRVSSYKVFRQDGIQTILFKVNLNEDEISDELGSASLDLSDKVDKLGFSLEDYTDGELYLIESD